MPTTPSRIHHAAYTTHDLEATRAVYEELIGLPLEAAWGAGNEISGAQRTFRHALFGLIDGSTLAHSRTRQADCRPNNFPYREQTFQLISRLRGLIKNSYRRTLVRAAWCHSRSRTRAFHCS